MYSPQSNKLQSAGTELTFHKMPQKMVVEILDLREKLSANWSGDT